MGDMLPFLMLPAAFVLMFLGIQVMFAMMITAVLFGMVTFGDKVVYIAGDTEPTPEMLNLSGIEVAFLPMNLPYTMTPQEAAVGARAFKPKVVYPYHFRFPFDKPNNHPQQFATAVRGSGIQVRVLDWYPQAAVARFMAASKS